MLVWTLAISIFVILAVSIYINARLYVYITGLEELIRQQISKNDRMFQSLKELVQEDYLLTDGRLKKFAMEKDKNKIYNGISVEDQESEF